MNFFVKSINHFSFLIVHKSRFEIDLEFFDLPSFLTKQIFHVSWKQLKRKQEA